MEATCENDGTPLRAPTADAGLAPRCRDSFFGSVRLQVWVLASPTFESKPLSAMRAHSNSLDTVQMQQQMLCWWTLQVWSLNASKQRVFPPLLDTFSLSGAQHPSCQLCVHR